MNSEDRDFLLGDWETTAEYRRVVETLDAETGEITSTFTTTTVRVVSGVSTRERPAHVGEGLDVYDHTVIVRREELPEWPVGTGARMWTGGREWLVVGGELAADGLCAVLRLKT